MSAPEPGAVLPDLIREDGPDRGLVRRVALLLAGFVCLALGLVGWLVPVVTGIPFYVLGAICLGMASKRAACWINARERRLPHRWRLWLRPRWRREHRKHTT